MKNVNMKNVNSQLEEKYLAKIAPIVNRINNSNLSKKGKLKIIYDYLVDTCSIDESFDMDGINQFPNIYGVGITAANKYGPVLYEKGVCSGFCRAYIDIAEKCNINVEMIEGIHQGFGHGWIMTLENGEPVHIDVYEGIKYKNGFETSKGFKPNVDSSVGFMRTTTELINTGRYRDFQKNMNEAETKLRNQEGQIEKKVEYREVQSGFKVRR